MDVHTPSSNNYYFKDWIKCKIKCSLLWLEFAFSFSSENCHFQIVFSEVIPIMHFLPGFSLFVFCPPSFIGFVLTLASEHQVVYILALLRLPNKQVSSILSHFLLFSLAIWYYLMASTASLFPFYHLWSFGYCVANLDYPMHTLLVWLSPLFKRKLHQTGLVATVNTFTCGYKEPLLRSTFS